MSNIKKKNNGGNTVQIATELLQPLLIEQSLILWDVRFEKEGSMWILRIIIDKEGGVDINDCEALSRAFDKILDEADPIENSYCLEVSSAGIERELIAEWHFAQFIGANIKIRLIRPYNDERDFVGKLIKLDNGKVSIECGEETFAFSMGDVAYVRLSIA